MEEILEILEKNFRYTDEQIAVMAGKTVEEVREAIQDYEEKSIMYGNGGDFTANTDGIGGTLAMASE